MRRIITLTTDFGLKDHYVGAMKGVILSVNPDALITDITHEIPPHDVFKGAFTLRNSYRYFPRGTVHVAVIDPGVGGRRRPIAVEADGHIFVGPDNGVFTFIYRESKSFSAFEITNPRYFLPDVSFTFHGRDIFAPVAANLSLGVSVECLGKRVKKPVALRIKEPEIRRGEIIGKIIYVDSFGNLITNIPAGLIKPESTIYVGKRVISGISKSYTDVPEGRFLAVIGSSGFLEISINRGRACDVINVGEELRVRD
ncbi:MAG TPA: SAM-dependent chlorinase/fluorinase [Thermodesulfobacteriota bacterium]|nr:SAM-dependent chlorinase/fluorinase [Thermodesulfobacteriota bacterium]